MNRSFMQYMVNMRLIRLLTIWTLICIWVAKTKHKKLVKIEIVEHRTFTAEIIGDKTSILDVRAVTEDGTRINIEVQLRDYGNMDRRSLFYWSREFAGGLAKGEDYSLLANDKEVLRLYHLREMAQIDYNSGMKKAKDEGRAEEKVEIARNAIRMNMPVDDIMKLTGLPRQQIEGIKV